jgi:uncharacterized protein YcbX
MRVTQLWRYPVKSMRGEALTSTRFARGGIPFDRRFAWIDDSPDSTRRGKPLTATLHPALLGYGASVSDSSIVVEVPGGPVMDVTKPGIEALLASLTGRRLVLREDSSGANHDDADVLVINEASVRQLAQEWGQPFDVRRFRPNVIVGGDVAFEEEAWIGRKLKVGGAVLEVVAPCVRCSITTVDPETLVSDPSFLRLMAQRHRACFGVYCAVSKPGDTGVGDDCALLPAGA